MKRLIPLVVTLFAFLIGAGFGFVADLHRTGALALILEAQRIVHEQERATEKAETQAREMHRYVGEVVAFLHKEMQEHGLDAVADSANATMRAK